MTIGRGEGGQIPYDSLFSPPSGYVKFFDPCRSWTWYATEFDGEDRFFGLIDGHEEKLGYFSLSELQSYKGALGIGIERDTSFRPTRLGDLPIASSAFSSCS